ncbi:MAG: TldD/PmbA family protein [Bacillota bacterium]
MVDKKTVAKALDIALSGGDFAEIFMEDVERTALSCLNGHVENALTGRESGVGVRVFDGVRTAYAIAPMEADALLTAARRAAEALSGAKTQKGIVLYDAGYPRGWRIRAYPQTVDMVKKMETVKTAYRAARAEGARITQATVDYGDVCQRVTVANSEGLWAEDERVRTRISIQAVASDGDESQTGRQSPGRAMGFELFERIDVEDYARMAARTALTMLTAPWCPAGEMPVVLDNGFGGVIFHEACGHALESTSVARGNSVFGDKLGQTIAAPCVSAADDGTLPYEWGSAAMDDEGQPTRRNMLITGGVLTGFMIDRLGARRMNSVSTGSGRRQSYHFAPTSRMTNTFILPGSDTLEEMIATMGNGLYAKQLGGGSVNPVTGQFNFAVLEGYLVKDGKISHPVRGAALIGKGAEVLLKIDRVGQELALGQGMCGSVSGSIPTSVGQPPLRITGLTVGGRSGATAPAHNREDRGRAQTPHRAQITHTDNTGYMKKLLNGAKKEGADEAEAYLVQGASTRVTVFGGEVDSFTDSLARGIGLRTLHRGKRGQSYSEAFDEAAAEMMIGAARQSAMLYDKKEPPLLCAPGPQSYQNVKISAYNGDGVSQKEKTEMALELYHAARDKSPLVRSVQHCALSCGSGGTHLLGSLGMDAAFSDGLCLIYIQPVVQEGGWTQTGFAFGVSRDFYSLDPKAVAAQAVERALEKRGAKPVPSGGYPVILQARAAYDLLAAFSPVFSAKRAQDGLSHLQGKEGEMIAAQCVTIMDDPLQADGFASAPFDGEGVPCRTMPVIENGRLFTLLHNRESAAKAGAEPTGHASRGSYKSAVDIAPSNFFIKPGEKGFMELQKEMGRGLVVTELEGLHAGVNTVSGDFSLPARGFYIEGGERVHAVEQVVLSGNFFELLKQVAAAGSGLEYGMPGGTCFGSPPLLINVLQVAGL